MSFNVQYTTVFAKALKRLAKKYPSLRSDYVELLDDLSHDPRTGTAIGKGCYKVRMSIGSKGKGKSGGARVILCACREQVGGAAYHVRQVGEGEHYREGA